MKKSNLVVLGIACSVLRVVQSVHAAAITKEITPSQIGTTTGWTDAGGNTVSPWLKWNRPTSASSAAATTTTYAEWDGFTAQTATSAPTGGAFLGSNLTTIPTAGDSAPTATNDYLLNGVNITNAYYTNTPAGDIYHYAYIIKPQITMPSYVVTGNQLNVLVQLEFDGSMINLSDLTVNNLPATSLPNYAVTQTYTDGGSDSGFGGTSYRDDYAWTFTLPADPNSLVLNFGWDVASSALVSAVLDTQSVTKTVPEPASLGLLGVAGSLLLSRRTRRA